MNGLIIMDNIEQYRNRFYNLMESKSGDVKPLLTENEVDEATTLWMHHRNSQNRRRNKSDDDISWEVREKMRQEEEDKRKKEQYEKDLFKYNRDIILYDFWKNPKLTDEEKNELQDLERRLSGSGIKGNKKTMLTDYKTKIYFDAFKKQYDIKTDWGSPTYVKDRQKEEYYGDMFKKLVNNEINIEDLKPIKPTNPFGESQPSDEPQSSDEKRPSFKDRVKGFFGMDE